MSDTVVPEQALALSVGIESYDYGREMDLPGAGAMALRFAEWALGCGIPPERVLLAATWAGQAPQMPDGLDPIHPTYEVLRKTIIGLRECEGELLLIFWCGHGVLDLKNQRALYTADATEADKRNIRVDEVLWYLASNTMMSFPRQIALIDACANFVEGMGYDEMLPHERFPAGKERRRIPQFSFYSAGQGQIAAYKRADRESTFSLAVLDWLEQYGSQSLPPDVAELTRHVQAVFDEKRKAGKLKARPVYLWVHTPEGSEIEAGDVPVSGNAYQRARHSVLTASQVQRVADRLREVPMLASTEGRVRFLTALAAEPLMTVGEVALSDIIARFTDDQDDGARSFAMLRALADTEEQKLSVQQAELCWRRQLLFAPLVDALSTVTFQQVQEAFFAAVPPGTKRKPRSLEDALEIAGDRLPSAGEETALHRLVARLERTSSSLIPNEWYRLSPDRLNALRERARAERPKRASLVIDLRNLGAADQQSTWPEKIYGHLRMPDGDWDTTPPCSCEWGVEDAVRRLVDDFHERRLEMSTVGFILPRAAFDLVPESWRYGNAWELPTPIWRRYPTVLHCGERLSAPPEIKTWWSTKAAAIKAALVTERAQIRWLGAGLGQDPTSITQLVRDASEACFGLEFAPGDFGGDMQRDPLIAMVAGGAPFLIWVEHEPANWDNARDVVADVVDGPFDQLPERVRRLRADHANGLGDEIRLVWDEPECLPPFGELSGL